MAGSSTPSSTGRWAFILTLPPSVNHLYARTRRGVMLTEEYERWKRDAGLLLLSQRLPIFFQPPKWMTVHLAFFVATRRSDWDNYIKGTTDALARACSVDDNRIYTGHVYKFIDAKAPHVEGVLTVDEEGPDLRAWRKFHLAI